MKRLLAWIAPTAITLTAMVSAAGAQAQSFPSRPITMIVPLPAGGGVKVEIDKVTLIPGALASGSVAFSDGVSAKWIIDQMGRPGFTEVSQPGYRPSPADGQAFMQELSMALQKQGF